MPVGPELPEPVWVSWEPECTLLALAYEHTIELCRTRPSFERFASVSIADSVAGAACGLAGVGDKEGRRLGSHAAAAWLLAAALRAPRAVPPPADSQVAGPLLPPPLLSAAGLWQSRQLYASTPTSAHVVFADPVTAFVQEVQV